MTAAKQYLTLLLCLVVLGISACTTDKIESNEFIIEGEIKGLGNTILNVRMPGKTYDTPGYWSDSVVVTDDKFSFSGETDNIEYLRFFVKNEDIMKRTPGGYFPATSNFILLFIEPGAHIKVKGEITDFVNAYPSGTKANDELAELHKEIFPLINEDANTMVKAVFTEDEDIKKQLFDSASKIGEQATILKKNYIQKNTSSVVSAMYLSEIMVSGDMTDDKAIELFESLDNKLSSLPTYKEMEKRIAGIIATKEGNSFPSLVTSSTPNGEPFDMSSYKGKYVLVDFWGVWCGPCVAEMPQVKEFGERYKDKLEIVGINSGDTKTKMMTFLEKNDYDWQQVISLNGDSEDNFVTRYNVQGFPTKFILDPEGKILKRYLGSGEDAFALLESLMDKP